MYKKLYSLMAGIVGLVAGERALQAQGTIQVDNSTLSTLKQTIT
jgi:hypothetical protein